MHQWRDAPAGLPAGSAIVLRIPGHVAILRHRSFAYSGPGTIYPIGNYVTTAPTTVALTFRFSGATRSRRLIYPTGVRGSFASSACAPTSVLSFSYPYL
jgi:hypothetical protein